MRNVQRRSTGKGKVLERSSFDLRTKTGQPNADTVSGISLVLRTFSERACYSSLSFDALCFNFDTFEEQDSVHIQLKAFVSTD